MPAQNHFKMVQIVVKLNNHDINLFVNNQSVTSEAFM